MRSVKNPSTIILVLACLQVFCSTYFLHLPGFYAINSFLFFFAGLGITVCLLNISPLELRVQQIIKPQLVFKLLFIVLLLPVSYQLARRIMDHTPLQIEYADMLPIIKTMCRRFLHGEWGRVYQPIPEIWNGVTPVYLPAMWLPFSSALLFDFDLRWVTVCGIWLSVIACLLPGWKKVWRPIVLVLALSTLVYWFHFDEKNNVIRLTEEGVVYFYYVLLTVAIISSNPWLLGLSVALCLSSRYSLIGWIPFALLFLLITKQYRFFLKTVASSSAIMLLFIFAFGVHPYLFHLHFQQDYISQATRVWHEQPEIFYESLGMARFFGSNHIQLLHYVLTGGTFLIPLIFLFSVRHHLLTRPNILLAGLQLSITFFYNFLDVSYLYLYYTPVFVSLAIAGWSLSASHWSRSAFVNAFQ